jgi:hypothetical protein
LSLPFPALFFSLAPNWAGENHVFFELLLRKSDPTIIPPKLGFCDQ